MNRDSDAWRWRAWHTDGTALDEAEHTWGEIDLACLAYLELVPQHAGLARHVLTLPAGSRPIFFRRRVASAGPDAHAAPAAPTTITCVGWQRLVGGQSVKSFTFFL